MRDTEKSRRCEFGLDSSLQPGVGLDIDVASGLVLQQNKQVLSETASVYTHQDDDSAVLDQGSAQRQQLLLSSTVVSTWKRVNFDMMER